jgi:hypothetical protein
LRADALASTASRPAFVTTRDRPSCRNRTTEEKPLIWALCEVEYFLRADWTTQISMIWLAKLVFSRTRPVMLESLSPASQRGHLARWTNQSTSKPVPSTDETDNRYFRNYPVTGLIADMPKSTRTTQSGRQPPLI